MNKQNLLSFKYLIKYNIGFLIKTFLKVMIPVIILFLGCNGYISFLDYRISSLSEKLDNIESNKVKYDEAQEMIKDLESTSKSNLEKLNYVKSLQGDFSQFDVLMSYLINLKPYDLVFISVEDLDIVPPPDMTSDIVDKDSVSDIFENSTEISTSDLEKEDNLESTESTESTENSEVVVDNIEDISNNGENWNSGKFDNSLTYTRDISFSHILIRGYSTNVNSVARYVDSVSKAPEIEGYTIEGVENKLTNIKDTDIVLFEIKLKMRGVLADE